MSPGSPSGRHSNKRRRMECRLRIRRRLATSVAFSDRPSLKSYDLPLERKHVQARRYIAPVRRVGGFGCPNRLAWRFHATPALERMTGLEPATIVLAERCSTVELHPHCAVRVVEPARSPIRVHGYTLGGVTYPAPSRSPQRYSFVKVLASHSCRSRQIP